MKDQILKILNKDNLRAFFYGSMYPIVIALLTVIGSITGLELYFNTLNVILIICALSVCETFKPLLINLCAFIYQLSVVNSPFYPNYSDYYVSSWHLPVLIIEAVAVVCALVYFTVKNKLWQGLSLKRTPLLLPLVLLSASFILGGLASSSWNGKTLVYALCQSVVFLLVYLLVYQGIKGENADGLGSYFAYISLIMSFIITAELLHLYAFSDSVIIDGSINKIGVALGWGIWNLIGISSAVLIPMCFFGMMKNRYPWLYFIGAVAAWGAAVLSMSRNALIFSTLAFAASVLVLCFVGDKKKLFRIITIAGIAFLAVFALAFFDKIYGLFRDFFDRGLSDNGRFALWRAAFDNFLDSPIFGKGFYGLNGVTDTFGAMPESAHCTPLQILSACGILGFAAYVFYRVKTVIPFVKKPTLMKTMLGISVLVLVFGSLLDNFIFDIYPTFYMTVALAIAEKKYSEDIQSD